MRRCGEVALELWKGIEIGVDGKREGATHSVREIAFRVTLGKCSSKSYDREVR
jgi:hypothetical protein